MLPFQVFKANIENLHYEIYEIAKHHHASFFTYIIFVASYFAK